MTAARSPTLGPAMRRPTLYAAVTTEMASSIITIRYAMNPWASNGLHGCSAKAPLTGMVPDNRATGAAIIPGRGPRSEKE